MLLEGIFIPVPASFYPDGRLYLRKVEHNVDRYSRTPAAGMIVCSPGPEAASLSDAETREALQSAITLAAPEKVMLASIGRESVFATLELADFAAALDYDVLLLQAPSFAAETSLAAELRLFFESVADRAPLPVMLVSDRTRPIARDLVVELAGHPNILGLLDQDLSADRMQELKTRTADVSREATVTTVFAAATARMLRKVEPAGTANFVSAESLGGGSTALAVAPPVPALKTRTKRVGFQVLSGSTPALLASWRAGASGAAPRLAACSPQACCEVWQAYKDGDEALAELKQLRIAAAGQRMDAPDGMAALRHGCDLNGYFGGRPRLPYFALNAEQRVEVEKELSALRN